MRIINDIHLGTLRRAGTTPASQQALTDYIQNSFKFLLEASDGGHLVINGDLFDGFTVDTRTVLWAYEVLVSWLAGPFNSLTLVAGNHDWNPRGDKLSSFHLLTSLLTIAYPDRVQVIDHVHGLTSISDSVAAIPHMPNQDLFDLELEAATKVTEASGFLLLHANYDNNFAVESDHSLNVSPAQAEKLVNAGWHLVFAHEHQYRAPRPGVTVVGNQFPTSVADCLGNDYKQFIEITNGEMKWAKCWSRDPVFIDTDWRHLDMPFDGIQFIRVAGTAKAEETDQVLTAINTLRKRHSAFVISNAVRIEGMAGMDELANLNMEEVQTYDVLSALLEELTPEEGKVVKDLLAEV
mgnify:FL=1